MQMRGAEFEGEYKTVEKFPLIIIPLGEVSQICNGLINFFVDCSHSQF